MAYRQKEYNYNDKLTKNQNLLMDKLYKMRMSGMAEAFENQLMNPNSGLESFETRFSEIINHEWLGRENKKFNRLLKQATLKYPAADLDSSLYDPERQLNTHVIELLAKGDWIDEPNNLLITGGAGAGKTHEFYKKYGGKTIIIARFVPIVRTFAPFVAGMGKMHYYYFMIYNLIGGAFWVLLFCYAGYFFGDLPFVQQNLKLLIIAIIFISILPAVIEVVRAKLKARKR